MKHENITIFPDKIISIEKHSGDMIGHLFWKTKTPEQYNYVAISTARNYFTIDCESKEKADQIYIEIIELRRAGRTVHLPYKK